MTQPQPTTTRQHTQNSEQAAIFPSQTGRLEKVLRLCRKKRRGAAVVEFAFVAPVFILLVFGMIEFGRMVMVQQIITNATREGARLSVVDGSTISDVEAAVTNYLTTATVTADTSFGGGDGVLVSPDPTTASFGDPITVTVQVDFSDVSWIPSPMYLGGTKLRAASVMRRESQ